MKRTIWKLTAGVFFAVLLLGTFSMYRIYAEVKKITLQAKRTYRQDSITSLMQLAASAASSYQERNRAIWALGQFADKKAIPFLISLQQQAPEKNSKPEEALSRYEIEKALRWCKEGNITHSMYSDNSNW